MKSGKESLQKLPEPARSKVINKYGGIDQYYDFVYKICNKHLSLVSTKSHQNKSNPLRDDLLKLEEELESFGFSNGYEVLIKIVTDHGDAVLIEHLSK